MGQKKFWIITEALAPIYRQWGQEMELFMENLPDLILFLTLSENPEAMWKVANLDFQVIPCVLALAMKAVAGRKIKLHPIQRRSRLPFCGQEY